MASIPNLLARFISFRGGRHPVAISVLVACCLACSTAESAESERSLSDLTGPWQLFVDDYLIAEKANIARTYHSFTKHPDNPIIRPDKPWEGMNIYVYGTALRGEHGQGYRMWYHALPGDHDYYRLLYAVSEDGVTWKKPNLGLADYNGSKDNNIFIRRGRRDHIPSVIHLSRSTDPQHQYAMINYDGVAGGYMAAWSPDGIHWTNAAEKPVFSKGGDVGQFVWDSLGQQYLGYVKNNCDVSGMRRRCVARITSNDITSWSEPELVLAPDSFDDRWASGVQRTHFYGLSAFAYETMYLGFLWVFRATDVTGYFDGNIFIELVTSRDGMNWLRQEGERLPILPLGEPGTWDGGMVFTTQHPIVDEKVIRLYYGGFDCTHAAKPPWHGAIGLATLRKDGFASLDAGSPTGTVTTKKLTGVRGNLRLNYRAAPDGWIKAEILNEAYDVVPGYSQTECNALTGNSTDQPVSWETRKSLPTQPSPIRLRFAMKDASLYSFISGETLEVIDEPAGQAPAVLCTFENDQGRHVTDKLVQDGRQEIRVHGSMKVDTSGTIVAFGQHALPIEAKYSPWATLEIDGTRHLGRAFTLALMAKNQDNAAARLFSSYRDHGPVATSEVIFDYDPSGRIIPGLRLTCKGIAVESEPIRFDDGQYHHLAVVYNQGRITFYLDGKEIGHGRVPGGEAVILDRNLFVGEDAGLGREEQFRGYLDDIVVLGKALTPAEISTLASHGAEKLFATSSVTESELKSQSGR